MERQTVRAFGGVFFFFFWFWFWFWFWFLLLLFPYLLAFVGFLANCAPIFVIDGSPSPDQWTNAFTLDQCFSTDTADDQVQETRDHG